MLDFGNKFFTGVIESRADPLKLGRCKVRVLGIHTEDTTILPTKDLPWAFPMQPITSGAMSGIGHSPTGPVEGTWVIVIFRDEGSYQEPIMLGTIGGIPERDESFGDSKKSTSGTSYSGVKDITDIESDDTEKTEEQGYLVDSDGNVVTDSSGNPVRTGSNVLEQVDSETGKEKDKAGHVLGSTSEKFETNGKGVAAINDYNGKSNGDYGGASYGKWQLASYMDRNGPKQNAPRSNPVIDFTNQSKYASDFAGLVPGTSKFDDTWRAVCAKDPNGFGTEQHDYIESKYYNKTLNGLRGSGIDLSNKGDAVQDAIWSTSVQYGPAKAETVFKRAIGDGYRTMTDAEIVAALQDDKLKNIRTDFKSSPALWRSLEERCKAEKAALLALAGTDSEFERDEVENLQNARGDNVLGQADAVRKKLKPLPSSGVVVPRTPDSNDQSGFKDPFSRYPRAKWIGEPDVSRLARNENIEETIMKAKRRTLIKGVGIAGGGAWSEPSSPYNAVYPLNHVYQSESGHITEIDDSPDAERIHTYHRSGSFVEYHPDGSIVFKSVKDEFEITVKDRHVYVGGNCNITVLGNTNIYSKGVMNLESDGDMNIKTGANLRIGAEGSMWIEANREGHIGAGKNLNASGSNIFLNCAWSPSAIDAGDHAVGAISVAIYDDGDVIVPMMQEDALKRELAKTDANVNPYAAPTKQRPAASEVKPAKADTAEQQKPKTEEMHPNLMLSTNYSLADMTTSTALTKHELREQIGLSKDEIFNNLSVFAKNVLEPLRSRYGNEFIITSGFRQGSGTSQHLKGQAGDIQFPNMSKEEAVHRAQEISKLLPSYDQIILEYHGRNPVFHISFSKDRNRGQKLTTPNLSSYFAGFSDKNMNRVYT